MARQKLLFEMFQGDDRPLSVIVRDKQGKPIPIVGWAFKVTAKSDLSIPDSEAEIALNISALNLGDSEIGKLVFNLPRSGTAVMPRGLYFLDVKREISGYTSTVINGRFLMKESVTRRDLGEQELALPPFNLGQ